MAWIDGVAAEPRRVRGWALDNATIAQVVAHVTAAENRFSEVRYDDEPVRYDDAMTVDGEVVEPTDLDVPLALTPAPPGGRHRAAEPPVTGCAGPGCTNPIPDRSGARYCSRACQQRAYRARKGV